MSLSLVFHNQWKLVEGNWSLKGLKKVQVSSDDKLESHESFQHLNIYA